MNEKQVTPVEEVLQAFDEAWVRADREGIVALFAEDATLESPLVLRLLNRKEGVLHGRDEIREMVHALMRSGIPWGRHDRPLTRGNTAAIEFRAAPPEGEGFYSVDVIEVRDGRIQSLRAYSGWRARTVAADDGHC